jgi:hypothetical protein
MVRRAGVARITVTGGRHCYFWGTCRNASPHPTEGTSFRWKRAGCGSDQHGPDCLHGISERSRGGAVSKLGEHRRAGSPGLYRGTEGGPSRNARTLVSDGHRAERNWSAHWRLRPQDQRRRPEAGGNWLHPSPPASGPRLRHGGGFPCHHLCVSDVRAAPRPRGDRCRKRTIRGAARTHRHATRRPLSQECLAQRPVGRRVPVRDLSRTNGYGGSKSLGAVISRCPARRS